MILKFPKDIYFYSQQYSNYRVLSEIANFDFDYLRAFGGEVHVWFSTFDTYEFSINIPSYNGHTLTCRHRPRHVDNDNEWSFYYNKDLKDNENAFKYYHDNMSYYQKAPRDYLTNNYKPSHAIESSLIIIKSARDILERNNIKRYTFYKPLKQRWWEEKSNNKCEWFDTGDHYDDIKNHTLGYLVKKDFWKNQNWAKAFFMIKIFCLYFQALDEVYKKPMYSPDYVEKLYNGFKKHCKVDFEFICYSDTPVKADKVIPLPKDSNIKRHWHKLKFFDKEFTGEGDIIVLDIDQVIVNDITEMVNYPVSDNELVSYEKWWTTNKENIPINGGWYKFKAGSLKFVHDKYMKNPEKWQTHYFNNRTVHYKYYGEQNFVYDTCVDNGTKITRMPGKWISKYDKDPEKNLRYNKMYMDSFDEPYMILGEGVNENIKIVHFANVWNNIHDNEEAWVKDNWQ